MPRSGSSGLPFQDITSKLSSDELVKRLKACLKYLLDTEELNDASTTPLTNLASTLLQSFVQHHKSRDVRLLAACCLAELFRVFYPDPPYDEEELKTVFSLFVTQLQGLEKPSSPSFKWSFQLLESVASVKAFNVCLSLDAQDILTDLFKMIFSIVNDAQSTKVKLYLLDMMSSLVQEGETLPQEVMDTILCNIVEPHKSENKAAYTFAVEFIRRSSTYLEPYIQLFFNNALVVGKSAESEVGDHLYDLILELHAIESTILLSVMPQLEFKLKSSDTEERLEVTRLLARMFSPRESRLALENKPLWLCFLGRFNDVSTSIRMECVKFSKYFIVYHSKLAEDTAAKLHERFHDREDKVRLEVVRAVCEAAADNMQAVPQRLLDDLQERMRDKAWSIRKEAMSNVAKLYRQVVSSSFSSGVALNKVDADRVSWMPNKILHSYYQTINEDRLCVERCLLSCIVPVNLREQERMERLVYVYSALDDHATRALEFLLRNRDQLRRWLLELIKFHQDSELQAERKKQLILTKVIQLARCLPDSVKAQAHLQELVGMLDDDQLRENLSLSLDTDCHCQDIIKAKGEVLSKIGSRHGILETVKTILDRSCPMLVDQGCVGVLVRGAVEGVCEPALSQSQEEEREEFERAKKTTQLLKVLAGITPNHFRDSEVFERLISLLRHEDREIASNTLQILMLTGKYIESSAAGCLQPILVPMAQKGPPELAKYTVRCICAVFREPKPIIQRLYNTLVSKMSYEDANLHTKMVSLGEIARQLPTIFETRHREVIRDFVVKKLLVIDRAQGEYVEGGEEWCVEEEVSHETRTKVLGVRLLVQWLLGLQGDHEKAAQPVLRLLDTMLAHDGDLQGEDNISTSDRSRLRLAASCGLLKVARSSHYHDLISQEQFQRLALTMQDTCDQVRDQFAHKLNKGLRPMKLPLQYLSVFALAGIEPRKEARQQFRQMIVQIVEKRRECLKQHSKAKEHPHAILPEYALSHTIHLLAHHPDFSRTHPQALDNFKDCLWFFLEPVVHKSDNYGFLRKLIESVKQTHDAQDPDNHETNKNLYAVCDLALGVLTKKLTHIKIGDFPGSVVLPKKLFKSRGKDVPVNDVRYLPPDYDCTPSKRLRSEGLSSPVRTNETTEATPSRKSKSPRAKPSRTKTPTKPAKTNTPKKEAPKRKSPASKTPRGRAQKLGRAQTGERKAAATSELEDSGVSDVEDKGERQEEGEEEPTPSRGRKRQTAAKAPTKRNVRRKVLQEPEETPDTGDTDEPTSESQADTQEGGEPSPKKRTRTHQPPARVRTTKRKASEDLDSQVNGVGQSVSESQSEPEAVVPPTKKRKAKSSAAQEPSITIKRKARRRK